MAATLDFPEHSSLLGARAGEAFGRAEGSAPSYDVPGNASRGIPSAEGLALLRDEAASFGNAPTGEIWRSN